MSDTIFRSGTLELPLAPPATDPLPEAWIDMGVNRILVFAAVLILLASLKGFLRVAPHIFRSLGRSRGCLNLEHSYSMATLRSHSAIAFILPFCLIADRYSLLPFLCGWTLPEWAGSLAVLCVMAVYVILRNVIYYVIVPGRMDYDYSKALNRTLYTLFIVLCLALLVSLAISIVLNVPSALFRRIFLIETAVFYAISLLRTVQFLSVYCSGFATILYLCALEFVPLAAVAAACAFLSL